MSNKQVSIVRLEELQREAEKPGKIHFVSTFTRPGTRLFTVYLEYNHYPPRTTLNFDFEMKLLNWPGKKVGLELMWAIVSIPECDMHLAEEAANASGMIIKEGTPIVFGGDKEHKFPMRSPSVYSLESNPKSRVYQQETESILEAETAEIQRIFQEDEENYKKELRDQGLSNDQIDALLKEIHNE